MFAVYCIECQTPNHLYVGQSKQFEERLGRHLKGDVGFTQRHGVKTWCLVNFHDDLNGIRALERQEYFRLKAKGFIVGGFSTLEGTPVGYALGEAIVEGPQLTEDVHPLSFFSTEPIFEPPPIPAAQDPNVLIVLHDTSLESLGDKGRALAILSNISIEAAKSRVRRAKAAEERLE